MNLFRDKLIERGDQRYLFIINLNNHDEYSDLEILEKTLKSVF